MDRLTLPLSTQLWQIGCVHGVERQKLHALLGEPHFVETDSSSTYGGDEDWWGFKMPSGQSAVICLRVPYQDAVVMTDMPDLSKPVFTALADILSIGSFEVYEHAYIV